MAEIRFNYVGLILGARGTGKTLFMQGSQWSSKADDAKLGIKGLVNIWLGLGMKVLIVDTLDHPSYKKFPLLPKKDFPRFKKGVARLFLNPDDANQLVTMINTSPHMNNTAIVFEDAGKYTESKLSKPFVRLLADSKQRNIDVVFMFHCWIDTPANIFTKADFIQIFKTEDSPEVRSNRIRLYDKVEQAYLQVKNNPDRFYSKFVDTRTN